MGTYVMIVVGCFFMAFLHTAIYRAIQMKNQEKIEELKALNMLADLHLNTIISLNIKLDTIGFKMNFDVDQLILEQGIYIKELQDVIEISGMINRECSLRSVDYVRKDFKQQSRIKKAKIRINMLHSIAANWQKEIDKAMAKKIIL